MTWSIVWVTRYRPLAETLFFPSGPRSSPLILRRLPERCSTLALTTNLASVVSTGSVISEFHCGGDTQHVLLDDARPDEDLVERGGGDASMKGSSGALIVVASNEGRRDIVPVG